MDQAVKHPSEVLKKGDVVEAMVLNIDAENQRLSLGLKQLATDIWDEFFSQHHVGTVVEGKVVRLTNFGAFVELDEGHRRADPRLRVRRSSRAAARRSSCRSASTYQMKIIKLSPTERKIGSEHPRDEGRPVPQRLGSVYQENDGHRHGDVGGSTSRNR